MSKGSQVIPVRVPDDLLQRIDEAITSNNAFRAGEPYDRSKWIRQAIEERLAKLARGRRSGRAKKREWTGKVVNLDQGEEEGS